MRLPEILLTGLRRGLAESWDADLGGRGRKGPCNLTRGLPPSLPLPDKVMNDPCGLLSPPGADDHILSSS